MLSKYAAFWLLCATPNENRGVGSTVSQAGRFGNLGDYLKSANEQICLIVKLETQAGIEALDDMLAADGIDGVFIGLSGLSVDMGIWVI